jgi:hypothetical protein
VLDVASVKVKPAELFDSTWPGACAGRHAPAVRAGELACRERLLRVVVCQMIAIRRADAATSLYTPRLPGPVQNAESHDREMAHARAGFLIAKAFIDLDRQRT